MGAAGEEFAQPPRRERNRVRSRHAERIEALRMRGFGQRRFELVWT